MYLYGIIFFQYYGFGIDLDIENEIICGNMLCFVVMYCEIILEIYKFLKFLYVWVIFD